MTKDEETEQDKKAKAFFGGKSPAEEFSESYRKWVQNGRDD